MGKLSTPDWIREGFDSKADWQEAKGILPDSPKRGQVKEKAQGLSSEKKSSKSVAKKGKVKSSGKMFKVRKCPKCGSHSVTVVLVGEEGKKADNWECGKCKWKGKDVLVEEVGEEEFLKWGDGE